METGLTIQKVAQQTGLSIDTLRYYERIGLLEPVGRAQNGHRRYTQHDLAWIDLLIRLRDTGMPRAQMVHFAQLRRQGSATATERRLILERHSWTCCVNVSDSPVLRRAATTVSAAPVPSCSMVGGSTAASPLPSRTRMPRSSPSRGWPAARTCTHSSNRSSRTTRSSAAT